MQSASHSFIDLAVANRREWKNDWILLNSNMKFAFKIIGWFKANPCGNSWLKSGLLSMELNENNSFFIPAGEWMIFEMVFKICFSNFSQVIFRSVTLSVMHGCIFSWMSLRCMTGVPWTSSEMLSVIGIDYFQSIYHEILHRNIKKLQRKTESPVL